MDLQSELTPAETSPPTARPAAPRKRFRVEKLEERIAPAAHYNPHSKLVGGGGNDGGSSNSGSGDSYSGSIY